MLLLAPPNSFLENPWSVPRIGLLYLGTVLRDAGHDVVIYHLNSLKELRKVVIGHDFDFIGITATTREYPAAIQILNYLKREKYQASVVIGGPHATALPDECLRNGFDFVLTGEAEKEIERLVTCPSMHPQIINCGYITKLDDLPFPDRTLSGEREQWQPFLYLGQAPNTRIASILISRGCPYRCAFCGPHDKYRRRSHFNIGAEMKQLHQQGYSGVIILDDLPFLKNEQVVAFCDLIQPLQIKFRCNFRPNLLTHKMAQRLAQSGCCRIQLGIESASQRILKTVKKRTKVDSNGQAITLCRDFGIQVKAMFIFGLPGDGPNTAEAIIAWVKKYRPDSIQVSSFVPLPGSPLWNSGYHRHVTDYSALSFFNNNNGQKNGVGNDRFSAEELQTLQEEILLRCRPFTHIDKGLPEGLKK